MRQWLFRRELHANPSLLNCAAASRKYPRRDQVRIVFSFVDREITCSSDLPGAGSIIPPSNAPLPR